MENNWKFFHLCDVIIDVKVISNGNCMGTLENNDSLMQGLHCQVYSTFSLTPILPTLKVSMEPP